MRHIILDCAIVIINTVIFYIIFDILYNKFNIREKFFGIFGKNKIIYYLTIIFLILVLILLFIILPRLMYNDKKYIDY